MKANPQIEINTMENNTAFPIPESVVQQMLNMVLQYGIPQMSQSEFDISLPSLSATTLPAPDGREIKMVLASKGIEASGGAHLAFASGASLCVVGGEPVNIPGQPTAIPVCE